jgi:hypothetical protein
VVVLLFDFNPHPTCHTWWVARQLNWAFKTFTMDAVPIRVGRWHLERELVHGVIRAKVGGWVGRLVGW